MAQAFAEFRTVRVSELEKGVKYEIAKIEAKGAYTRTRYIVSLMAFASSPTTDERIKFYMPSQFMNLCPNALAQLNADCACGNKWHFVKYGKVGVKTICKLHRPGIEIDTVLLEKLNTLHELIL